MPLDRGFERLVPSATAEDVASLVEAYRAAWFSGLMHQCPTFDGMQNILSEQLKRGRRQIVASAKSHNGLKKAIDRYELTTYFHGICGALPGEDNKTPVVQRALQQSGSPSEHCLMIGDRHHDLTAAYELSIPFALVTWGGMTTDAEITMAREHDVAIFTTPADLQRHLEQMP